MLNKLLSLPPEPEKGSRIPQGEDVLLEVKV